MAGISDVANVAGIKPDEVKALFNAIKVSTDPVIIKGFGTFKTVTRKARTARNPKTGEAVQVPEKTVLAFKAAK